MLNIVFSAVETIDRNNLRTLAHHCGIKLEGNYTIDKTYLQIKTKAELIECSTPIMEDRRDDWAKDCKLPGNALVDLIEGFDHVYGVPADLIEYYNADIE